ncbi:MAG: hypothetical protein AAGJ51_01540 [Pseudomonadota bacterium]
MTLPRIRQLVFASKEHDDIEVLRAVLDLGPGFVDPGVAEFGLTNGVFAIGDQFLETVVPVTENTAAGRFMERRQGLGGYMAIFQTDNLARVRDAADALSIRRVWNIDLSDISASHLHPADMGAAIVSIDEARPEGAWRWGGPDWTANARPGGLTRLDISAIDPRAMSAKWSKVLAAPANDIGHGVHEIDLAEGAIRFLPGARDHLSGYVLKTPDPAACLVRAEAQGLACESDSFLYCGVKLTLTAIDPDA